MTQSWNCDPVLCSMKFERTRILYHSRSIFCSACFNLLCFRWISHLFLETSRPNWAYRFWIVSFVRHRPNRSSLDQSYTGSWYLVGPGRILNKWVKEGRPESRYCTVRRYLCGSEFPHCKSFTDLLWGKERGRSQLHGMIHTWTPKGPIASHMY